MKKSNANLLLHPVFLLALIVLYLNDVYWKQAFPNWFTGKLSDVAGIIVLPVFLRVLFARLSVKTAGFICAVFFIWWKLPASQPVINLLRNHFHLPINREVDGTDLFVLVLLPLALKLQPLSFPLDQITTKCLRWALGVSTFILLCSTTAPYRSLFQAHPQLQQIYFDETITRESSAQAVLETLLKKGIACQKDSLIYYPVSNQSQLYYRTDRGHDTDGVWQQVSQRADSTLYVRWEGPPFYIIPFYQSDDGEIRNIRFTLTERKNGARTVIRIETFRKDGLASYYYMDKKTKKAFRNIFEELFRERK